jgi:hypothetical protein
MTDSTPPVWTLTRTDLWWLFALPVYVTFGTLRHESSHALLATIEGAKVTNMTIWPSTDLGRFTWGYTQWDGKTDWVVSFAPYFCDLIWFVGFFLLITRIRWRTHWVWLNLVIFGLISALVNSGWQWLAGFFSPASDVGVVRGETSDGFVQPYFLLTLALYVIGLIAVFWRVPRILLPDPAPA